MSKEHPFVLNDRQTINCSFRDPKKPCGPAVTIIGGVTLCQMHRDRLARMEACGGIPRESRRKVS